MRSSVLSRSVIAIASLAIGSVALAAVPATAATPSGITRDQVLTAVASERDSSEFYTPAAEAAYRSMITAHCKVSAPEAVTDFYGVPTQAGGQADGLLVSGFISGGTRTRSCDFGVVATVDPSFTLTGTSSITGRLVDTPGAGGTLKTYTAPLSGDVAATAPIDQNSDLFSTETTFTAAGNAAKTTTVQTITKVKDKKTTSEKKAAKKKYDKRLKAAKKSYKKALDKAGKSKNKKAAAKKAYSKKKASAKAIYKNAIAGFKLVKSSTTNTENRPFSLSARYSYDD